MTGEWVRVTKAQPCPICKKPDWCGVSRDGVWAVCMRTENWTHTRNGGWLHCLRDLPPPPERRHRREPPRPQMVDYAAYHAALRRRWDRWWLDGLSMSLGVNMEALERLEPAFDAMQEAFAFPMRDGAGRIVGVRLRSHDGHKWALRGSRAGLFFDPAMAYCKDLLVCEGPTDCAAALSLGRDAVGRPCCAGAVAELKALALRVRAESVTIIADHDAPHRRPNGTVFYPGMDGAFALGAALRRKWRVVLPPAKDLRAWVGDGGTRGKFEQMVKNSAWRVL